MARFDSRILMLTSADIGAERGPHLQAARYMMGMKETYLDEFHQHSIVTIQNSGA